MPPLNYAGKVVLAPMVRAGELPARLVALNYGADLVWSPEIVDKKLLNCRRVVNDKINCIDYVLKDRDTVVFRTHRILEKNKLVFQLGTASPSLAVEAATIVAQDVAGIDVNSGCPKHFSIHSGMGAALLSAPDTLVAILESLVANVGKKFDIGISVKIRLLKTPEDTFALVRRLCATGISALTVHCRHVATRPREPATRTGYLSQIAHICRDAGVTCIVNGDVKCRGDLAALQDTYNVDSAMIATAAESNLSCFQADSPAGLVPWRQVAQDILTTALAVDNHFSNTKFSLAAVVPGKDPLYQKITRSRTYGDLESAFSASVDETEQQATRKRSSSSEQSRREKPFYAPSRDMPLTTAP